VRGIHGAEKIVPGVGRKPLPKKRVGITPTPEGDANLMRKKESTDNVALVTIWMRKPSVIFFNSVLLSEKELIDSPVVSPRAITHPIYRNC
jgi:hypothetical protein